MKKIISLVLTMCVLAAPVAAYADAEIPSPKQGAISMREQVLATRLLPTRAVEQSEADKFFYKSKTGLKMGCFNMYGDVVIPEEYLEFSHFYDGYEMVCFGSNKYGVTEVNGIGSYKITLDNYEVMDNQGISLYRTQLMPNERLIFYKNNISWIKTVNYFNITDILYRKVDDYMMCDLKNHQVEHYRNFLNGFHEGMAWVTELSNEEEKYLIDTSGNILYHLQSDENGCFEFSDGYTVVEKGEGQYYILSKSGNRITVNNYPKIILLKNNLFLTVNEAKKWQLIDFNESLLLDNMDYAELTGDYLVLYEKDGKYGAFDYWGNTVEEASYDTLGELKDALGYWTLAKDGDLYGYQNSKGEWVIEPQFTAAEEFINPFGSGCVNYAYVETPKCHGYINSEGEFFAVLPEGNDAEVEVIVNGEYVEFDVPPMLENDRTLVPMRAIFEALGAEVSWYPEDETIVAVRGDTTVFMQVDDWYMSVNDEWIRLDAPPRIVNDRMLIPLRAVAEAFGAQVGWDAPPQTVTVELD